MNFKKLSIIIALKRRNKNSCFRKKANHIIAGELGISAYLFSKLIKELISDGFIVEKGNYYQIVKFKEIIREFYYKKDLYIGKFELLKNESLNYHQILNKLYSQIIITNIVDKQQHLINKKQGLLASDSRTVLKANRYFLKKRYDKRSVDEITASIDQAIRTSARAVAKMLEVSLDKANKILNQSELFCREIVEEWVDDIFDGKLEKLKLENKNTTVIPYPERNKYKLCFGSIITLPTISI